MFKVGTSGFSYADWKGHFYPKGMADRDMLAFYAERYPMVEINATYYQVPSPKNVRAMVEKVPEGFEFVVKTHRSITHVRGNVYEAMSSMGLGFVNCDMPAVRGLMPPTDVVTSDIAYVRLHGRNAGAWYGSDQAWERYDYSYSDQELTEWVPRLLDIARRARKAYVVFNNHPRGQSAKNADTMRRKLAEADPGAEFVTGLEMARRQTSLNGF
jgi:uncharacterized protein YecE (DUF72 family)